MEKSGGILAGWFFNFARNRDLIHNKIERVDEEEMIIHYKDGQQHVVVEPFLGDLGAMLDGMEKENHYALVVFNTKENFKKVLDSWKRLAEFRFLMIYFANPLSQQDKKWIIAPYTHSRIADERALRKGLTALFQTVDEFMPGDAEKLESQNV